MLIACTTRGCLQTSEAKIDRDTNDVVCDECGNVIDGVTSFTKKALSSMGQVIRRNKKKPFQALCKSCNTSRSLFLKGESAHCESCDSQVHVSDAFLNGLRVYLKNQEKR